MIPAVIGAAAIGAASTLGGAAIQSYGNWEVYKAQRDERKRAAKALKDAGKLSEQEYNTLLSQIDTYYKDRGSLGTEQDASQYRAAINGYDPNAYVIDEVDKDDFKNSYDKTKEDFVTPYFGKIIGDTSQQLQHTAAGAGLGRGTGAALNIAKGVAEKEDSLYRTAIQDYNADRTQAYKEYTDAIDYNQNRLNNLRLGTQYKMGLQGDLANDYYDTQDSRQADLMSAQQDRLASRQAYNTAILGLY